MGFLIKILNACITCQLKLTLTILYIVNYPLLNMFVSKFNVECLKKQSKNLFLVRRMRFL